jgi:AraC family cel operon transcriptional repressor
MAAGQGVSAHGHDFSEIFLIEKGSGVQILPQGRQELVSGMLCMIRAGDVHQIRAGAQGLSILNLAFPSGVTRHLKARYFRDNPAFFGKGALPPLIKLSAPGRQAFVQGLEELRQLKQSRLGLERFLINFFSRQAMPLPLDDFTLGPPWLLLACRMIKNKEEFSKGASRFAELALRSPAHVSRECRRVLGLSPTDLVNAARLDYAAAELTMSSRDILELALDCGFESLSHFYRAFKSRFHCPPRRYRLRSQQLLR